MSEDLSNLFWNKRVILVGPANTLVGGKQGKFIDSHDVVVRLNHQWPIPEHLVADIGSRMDVLYHCCNGDYPVSRLFTDEFKNTKLVCYESGFETYFLQKRCQELGIPTVNVTSTYFLLQKLMGSYPTTGLSAIYHLLQNPICSLFVTGLTFLRTPYYPGYRGAAAQPDQYSIVQRTGRYWKHDLNLDLRFFMEALMNHPKIQLDSALSAIVAISPGRKMPSPDVS